MDFRPHMANLVSRIGQKVSYFPLHGDMKIVDGVFESPPREFLGMESMRPSISCLSAEVQYPAHGDEFELHGKRFKVVEVEKDDGSGICRMGLEVKS